MKIYRVYKKETIINYKQIEQEPYLCGVVKCGSILKSYNTEQMTLSKEKAQELLEQILYEIKDNANEIIKGLNLNYYIKYLWENGQPYKQIMWAYIEEIDIQE